MMALTAPRDLQQAHVLGRQDQQGQAEPKREMAAAASAYRCPHRCPAAGCAKLGGSGEHPTWSAEGASQTQTTAYPLLFHQAAAAALHTCKPAASKHPWKKRKQRLDRRALFHHQTVTILTPGQDTATAAFLVAAARLLKNTSLEDFSPTTYGRKG